MSHLLLILQDTLNSAVQNIISQNPDPVSQTATPAAPISLINLLQQGGFIMYPLYLLFVLVIFIFFQRIFILINENKNYQFMVNLVKEQFLSGNYSLAIDSAQKMNNSMGRVIAKGIQKHEASIEVIDKSMENAAKFEIFRFEKNLNILSLIAGIAPMFGFLGTIVGMVQLFYNISATGEYTLNTIAGGIYTKMITSASGLIIGVLAYIAYNYISTLIDKKVNQIEIVVTEFIDLFQAHKH
ncbi:MAG: MotA/TolQ/ExbB proton channel family protein [Alphaproteobacteria bacterium]|nr:MotA/TolQ/ExbB proton channel family protein [Alphaproteobacteria bacterium]